MFILPRSCRILKAMAITIPKLKILALPQTRTMFQIKVEALLPTLSSSHNLKFQVAILKQNPSLNPNHHHSNSNNNNKHSSNNNHHNSNNMPLQWSVLTTTVTPTTLLPPTMLVMPLQPTIPLQPIMVVALAPSARWHLQSTVLHPQPPPLSHRQCANSPTQHPQLQTPRFPQWYRVLVPTQTPW